MGKAISPKACKCGNVPLIRRDKTQWVFTVYCPNAECKVPPVSQKSKGWAVRSWNEARILKNKLILKPEDLFKCQTH